MRRASYYVLIASLIAMVNDGWSGRPGPFAHQLLLLPVDALFLVGLLGLLERRVWSPTKLANPLSVTAWLWVCGGFELVSLLSFRYEAKHFAQFGYHMSGMALVVVIAIVLTGAAGFFIHRSAGWLLFAAMCSYAAGAVLSIRDFPLNYLRSDMLPVVQWADQRLAHHLNPYTTIHIGNRLYDFPYLPGVLAVYLPVIALGLDPRWLNLACVLLVVGMLYGCADLSKRLQTAALIAIFVLSPFLQYRHELYLAPHWFALTGAVILLQGRRYNWAAAVFGLSMAIYQLSWVLWPFLLLYALRRRGWREVIRSGALSLLTMGLVIGPFLRSAFQRIASNTVGQWSRLPHALAEPINVSYWATYLVRPDQLKWVQLGVLSGVFIFCIVRGRCRTLEDTLRWMCAGLAIFIALNVLVDGYFYLTLLLLLLMYTLSSEGLWPAEESTSNPRGNVPESNPASVTL